jgi:hypothetical protein
MRKLHEAKCDFCGERKEVVLHNHHTICRECLAEILAFYMKSNQASRNSDSTRKPQKAIN